MKGLLVFLFLGVVAIGAGVYVFFSPLPVEEEVVVDEIVLRDVYNRTGYFFDKNISSWKKGEVKSFEGNVIGSFSYPAAFLYGDIFSVAVPDMFLHPFGVESDLYEVLCGDETAKSVSLVLGREVEGCVSSVFVEDGGLTGFEKEVFYYTIPYGERSLTFSFVFTFPDCQMIADRTVQGEVVVYVDDFQNDFFVVCDEVRSFKADIFAQAILRTLRL